MREPNIHDPQAFVDRFQGAHNLLLHRSKRLSLTLPDSVGRIMLLDMEGRFKNRAEGLDMIRWKLKKNIPFDAADTHLDYQVLNIRENGGMALLVALVSRAVIGQYEEVLTTGGFTAARIDLNSFNLYRIFDLRLALLDDSSSSSFTTIASASRPFYNGVPEFIRVRSFQGRKQLTPAFSWESITFFWSIVSAFLNGIRPMCSVLRRQMWLLRTVAWWRNRRARK